jgi:hypothetical protein
MTSSESPPNTTENEVELMRRALGLTDHGTHTESPPDPRSSIPMQRHDQDRRARRFVRDGEVPVVVLNRARDIGTAPAAPTNRLAIAENALKLERGLRERAERALHEAQASVQHLQTQMGHAKLAHAEALAAEREARELAERHVLEAVSARQAAEAKLAEVTEALHTASKAPPVPQVAVSAMASQPISVPKTVPVEPRAFAKPTGKPKNKLVPSNKSAAAAEPEAVKWWLPSFKARGRSA